MMELKKEKVITFDELVKLIKPVTEEDKAELDKYQFVIDSEIIILNKPMEMYHLKFLDLRFVNCTIRSTLSSLCFNFSALKVNFTNCYIDCNIEIKNCRGYIAFDNTFIVKPINLYTYKQVLEIMDGIKGLTQLVITINNSSLKSKLADPLNIKMLNIQDYGNIYDINILHNSYIESIYLDECEKLKLDHSTIKQFVSLIDLADLKNLDLCVTEIIHEEKPATMIMSTFGAYDKRNLTKSYINGVFLDKSIIGYKKVCIGHSSGFGVKKEFAIVKLRIPKGAIVFGNNLQKCRTNKAKVLDILVDGKSIKESAWYKNTRFTSSFDENFTYSIGDNLSVKDFCLINSDICASGIHFFLTKEEAEQYYIY